MHDDVMDQMDRGYLELARRLEAYADLRLAPSLAGTTGMRASVMQAAHRRAALIQADPTLTTVAAAPAAPAHALPLERARTARAQWRRPLAAMLAASLTVGIVVGSLFAASPGGPLYAARLWVEMANLPTDPAARAQAELTRLQDRLGEAQQASSAGDGPATAAALSAYSAILLEAELGSSGNSAASAAIEAGIARHVVVLTQLLEVVPATARAAIEHALASSTKILIDLHDPKGNGGNDGIKPAQPGGAGGPGPAGQPAKPSSTDRPAKPANTVHPARPEASHPVRPEKTSAPAKPANGQGQSARD
jgi:hypothetical protein